MSENPLQGYPVSDASWTAGQPSANGVPASYPAEQMPAGQVPAGYMPVGYPAYQQPIMAPPTNGFAIAGLICSFFLAPVGLILSIIGLVQSKSLGGAGKGMSIAGITISLLFLAAFVAFIGFLVWLSSI